MRHCHKTKQSFVVQHVAFSLFQNVRPILIKGIGLEPVGSA
jgi:hypothetical protein